MTLHKIKYNNHYLKNLSYKIIILQKLKILKMLYYIQIY